MTWIEAMAATASANKDSFEESKFMKDLVHLRDTQEAIQSLSGWCLKNKKSSYKIARCWLKVVKKGESQKSVKSLLKVCQKSLKSLSKVSKVSKVS